MIVADQAVGEPVDGALRDRFERLEQSAGGLRPCIELGELIGQASLRLDVQARRAVTGPVEDPSSLIARFPQARLGIGFGGGERSARSLLDLEHAIHRVCNGHVWLGVRHCRGNAARRGWRANRVPARGAYPDSPYGCPGRLQIRSIPYGTGSCRRTGANADQVPWFSIISPVPPRETCATTAVRRWILVTVPSVIANASSTVWPLRKPMSPVSTNRPVALRLRARQRRRRWPGSSTYTVVRARCRVVSRLSTSQLFCF